VAAERRAGRVLLIDGDEAVLLFEGFDPGDPDAGCWWLTPGGGAEDGESVESAAVREVAEETGLRIRDDQLGPVVATRVAEFAFEGRHYRQSESFFAVHTDRFEPANHDWEDAEHRSLLGSRWWTATELETTTATVYPSELAALLRAVLDGRPELPLRLSGE
jgi:8-oxo-dGTP pyrophosphatase MutT (NUDIX family)